VLLGALFGLAHGLLITRGRIEPFIVTLGTLGIFRAYLTYFSNGGAITLDNTLADAYAPVFYGALLGVPCRCGCSRRRVGGALILNRTAYGRYVQAIGSNEQVARYAAVDVDRIKVLTYMLLGVCVGIATAALRAAPRLGLADHRACCGSSRRSPR
jgi:ribose transport system permease protein